MKPSSKQESLQTITFQSWSLHFYWDHLKIRIVLPCSWFCYSHTFKIITVLTCQWFGNSWSVRLEPSNNPKSFKNVTFSDFIVAFLLNPFKNNDCFDVFIVLLLKPFENDDLTGFSMIWKLLEPPPRPGGRSRSFQIIGKLRNSLFLNGLSSKTMEKCGMFVVLNGFGLFEG